MRIEEIRELFAYDSWANHSIFDALEDLSDDELEQDLSSSLGSLLGTLTHIVGAEEAWLGRWLRRPTPLPDPGAIASLSALRARWDDVREKRDTFVDTIDNETLDSELEIATLQGETFTHSYRQMFQHVANHSTYHRGQIVTLLRQLGVEPPSTDLIRYHRLHQT